MPNTQVEVIIRLGPDRVLHRIIQPGEHLIGADPACGLQVEGNGVSRKHARVTFDGSQFLVEDLGSTNGTFLDGVRLTGVTPLRFSQQLQMGQAVLEITPALSEEKARPPSHEAATSAPDGNNLARPRSYRIGPEVARGGMGAIREAEHLSLRRKVAMKVMLSGKQATREAALRFEREARVLARLEHPNIVPVHDLGVDDDGQDLIIDLLGFSAL